MGGNIMTGCRIISDIGTIEDFHIKEQRELECNT